MEQNSNPKNENEDRFLWNLLLRVRRSTDIIRRDLGATLCETGDFHFNTHGAYVYNWELAMHFRNGAAFQSFGRDRRPPTLQFRLHVWVDRSLSGARCKEVNCRVAGGKSCRYVRELKCWTKIQRSPLGRNCHLYQYGEGLKQLCPI